MSASVNKPKRAFLGLSNLARFAPAVPVVPVAGRALRAAPARSRTGPRS
jgi:hypothetical protein